MFRLFLIGSLLPFNVIIVASLTFYYTNRSQIQFQLMDALPLLFMAFFCSAIILSFFVFLIRNRQNFLRLFSGLMVGLSIVVWIQSQLLLWDFGPLDGQGVDWSNWLLHSYFEIAIWTFLPILFVVLSCKYNIETIKYTKILFAVGFFSIFSTLALSQKYSSIDSPKDTQSFSFHADRNIIIILLDTFQSDALTHMINEDNDLSLFNGFTFFDNVISHFPNTEPSVPSFLTGQVYLNQEPFSQFRDRVYSEDSVFIKAEKRGYDVFSAANGARNAHDPTRTQMFHDLVSDNTGLNSHSSFQLFDFGLFRALPIFLKRIIYSDGHWFLQRKMSSEYPPEFHGMDVKFLELFENKFHVSHDLTSKYQGKVHYLHFATPHLPLRIDENLQYNKDLVGLDGFLRQSLAGLAILDRIFDVLKSNNIFDSSEILMLSDHGSALGVFNNDKISLSVISDSILSRSLAISLYKPVNGTDNPVKVDSRPLTLSHLSCLLSDLAVNDCSDLDYDGYRDFYFYTLGSLLTPDFLPTMTHFQVSGHSYNPLNWRKTGTRYLSGGAIESFDTHDRRYTIGETVKNQSIRKYLLGGWSSFEQSSVWSDGNKVGLAIEIDEKIDKDLFFSVRLHPFLGSNLIIQDVDLYFNGNNVQSWAVDKRGDFTAIIEKSMIKSINYIEFYISDPARPCLVSDSTDCRFLGVSLHEFSLDFKEESSITVPANFDNIFFKSFAINSLDLKGWSRHESTRRWTEGPKASMQFRLQDYAKRDIVLRLTASGFLGGGLPYQVVGVIVNGTQVAEWQVAGASEFTAVVPANLIADGGLVNLSFDISDPRAPCDYSESTDCRKLGMAVRGLVVDYVQ